VFKKWSGVAENVSIRDGNHQFKANPHFRLQETIAAPIEIGEGSGIGAGSVVLMGAKIAKGAFIGANSIVTKKSQIEENGIYAGNPLKFITKRN
jgi:acetyltransferase-like isoleucine patch superfamily enzyme